MKQTTAEHDRLRQADEGTVDWRAWGPYVSERAWGTVREDYSEAGQAWEFFPHDHARSRVYRWNEDGMAGVCDLDQRFCLALALWNGVDPILKERMFGLTGPQGNHGEDVKEYWWYLDATPTHSWARWRYHYPQREFPYDALVHHGRGRDEPEYELVDTGIFDDDRYWVVTVDHAKATPTDLCVRITVENRGPQAATLHVLPTLWFRNTWAWGPPGQDTVPVIRADGTSLVTEHAELGTLVLTGDGRPEALMCDNETNTQRLWGVPGRSAYPKDGINDHVVAGAATINPAGTGTKGALWYRLDVPAGGTATVRVRLTAGTPAGDFDDVMDQRQAEADAFYAALTPPGTCTDEALVLRQALAGMLWGKQFFHYDVARWLDGDPAGPPPPQGRRHGRNAGWRHLNNADVISMPDPWEYPWYAAWDLAFHCVPLAHVDPQFAKDQLVLLLREWYMHPGGQLPAYEWAFGDVNPPVHAWAALRVFECDGCRDVDFLARVFHKLLINFTWWVNRKDSRGENVFEGGFLGLDNIGPIDRSAALPIAGVLEQSDATAWMAMYCLNLLEMALILAQHDPAYEDVATKFFEHFALIATAAYDKGLWDSTDGLFYDVLSAADGRRVPMRVGSLVGLLPLCATMTLGQATLERLPRFAQRFAWFLDNVPAAHRVVGETHVRDGAEGRLLAMVGPEQLRRMLEPMLDEQEFLSPHGLRSVSRRHRDAPYLLDLPELRAIVDYEPGESTTGLFGGNSNWRGPVWFPVNILLVEALRRFAQFFGDDLVIEHPTGSGIKQTLHQVADDLDGRLIRVFLNDADGRRPVFGGYELFQTDPAWHEQLWFHEYFHGDTGAGLGASHQTGWTGLVAECLLHRHDPKAVIPPR
jgi:hypothetical protein